MTLYFFRLVNQTMMKIIFLCGESVNFVLQYVDLKARHFAIQISINLCQFSIRFGWCWENNNFVSFASGWSGDNDPNNWFQCGTGYIQKSQVSSLGSGWSDKYSTILAMLLQQYRCNNLCGGLGWSWSNRHFQRWTVIHAKSE